MTRTTMGNVIEDLTKLSLEKKQEYAKIFCEGDLALESLLVKMWENGIQTYASCAGHNVEDLEIEDGVIPVTDPYIYFEISSLEDNQLNDLLNILILLTKNSNVVKKFDLTIDKYMGFEKHGFRIAFNKNVNCYEVLGEVFDDVIFNKSTFDFLKISGKNQSFDKLTDEDKQFVNSIIDLNNIDFGKYWDSVETLKDDEQIMSFRLEYDKEMNIFVSDNITMKTKSFITDKNVGVICSEGMYVKDKFDENVFYTVKNNELVVINKSQLKDLKEFKLNRKYQFFKNFSLDIFEKLKTEIENVIVDENLNSI